MLIDNEMPKRKIAVVGDQINGKKERSRRLNKTVNQNATDILSSITAKTSHHAQLITLKMLVWLLQHQKQVRIERLAAALPLPIQQNSRRRHLQRFLSLNTLSVVLLWFPIIKEILTRQTKLGSRLIIALDRTQWKENNILMVSVIYKKEHCRYIGAYWRKAEVVI